MPSTYNNALRIEEIANGEQSGYWGTTTNKNLGQLIVQAIAGTTSLDVTAGNITLTALDGLPDESRSAVLSVTGTPGVTRVLTIPNVTKLYTVLNATANIVQVKTASGSAFDCPPLSQSYINCNGGNVVTGRSITDGANTITSSAAPFTSPAFTGVPTAPTAAVTTNTTQLATTAFVNAEIANDAPTKTGGGASGTWGIAITGNAGTATTLQTARTINGVSFNGSANITVTANTTNTLTVGTYLTGSNFNGSAATTWAVDATSANTASKVVARDASGNFSAGTITATLSGNATSATTATNSTQLGGVAAASYARRDVANNYAGVNTFVSGGIYSPAYNFTSITSIFSSGNSDIQIVVNGATRLKIDSNGDLEIGGNNATKASGTTWINPSDARLKDNVVSYTKGLNELVRIQPKSFTFNGKAGSVAGLNAIGIIADEIEQVLPNTVQKRLAKLNPDDAQPTEIRYFDSSELTWVMVNAIKELKAEFDAYKATHP